MKGWQQREPKEESGKGPGTDDDKVMSLQQYLFGLESAVREVKTRQCRKTDLTCGENGWEAWEVYDKERNEALASV